MRNRKIKQKPHGRRGGGERDREGALIDCGDRKEGSVTHRSGVTQKLTCTGWAKWPQSRERQMRNKTKTGMRKTRKSRKAAPFS
jgi:hypothetical protein